MAMTSKNSLKFFDCNGAFGPYRTRVFRFARTADELIEEMDFANIAWTLVYHTAMRFDHPCVGDELVVRETEGKPRLLPTWALLPSQTAEQPALKILLREMQQCNIRALRLFPDEHRYFLDEITWGDQMAVYMERRIPLFVRASLDKVAQLLRCFPNLMFETSGYLVDGGIEEFCQRYSASRLIFGSGFPDNASGAAMLALAQAEISEAERQLIAEGNLCRLLEEASLE